MKFSTDIKGGDMAAPKDTSAPKKFAAPEQNRQPKVNPESVFQGASQAFEQVSSWFEKKTEDVQADAEDRGDAPVQPAPSVMDWVKSNQTVVGVGLVAAAAAWLKWRK